MFKKKLNICIVYHIFAKLWSISKILSLTDSADHLPQKMSLQFPPQPMLFETWCMGAMERRQTDRPVSFLNFSNQFVGGELSLDNKYQLLDSIFTTVDVQQSAHYHWQARRVHLHTYQAHTHQKLLSSIIIICEVQIWLTPSTQTMQHKIYIMVRDQPNSREKMHDFTAEFFKCVKFHGKFTERVSEIHGPHRRYFEVLC